MMSALRCSHARNVRRCRHVMLLAGLLCLPGMLLAQHRDIVAGEHYQGIQTPLATSGGVDRIEVTDVFWYGCSECAVFEPMMSYWGNGVTGDLDLKRSPAVWNDVMETHARLYFSAVKLELAETAHAEAFRRIHEQGQPLASTEEIQAFFAGFGVQPETFQSVWHDEEVLAAVATARRETAQAGIDRLPALLVNGQYRVVRNHAVPTLEDVVITNNLLIRQIRTTRRDD